MFIGFVVVLIAPTFSVCHAVVKNLDETRGLAPLTYEADIGLLKKKQQKGIRSKSIDKKIGDRLKKLIAGKMALKPLSTHSSEDDNGNRQSDQQTIRVVLKTTADGNKVAGYIQEYGGRILKKQGKLTAIEIPVQQVEQLLTDREEIEHARLPYMVFPLGVTSEGVDLTGASRFHKSGRKGAGIRIAVIDVGFKGLTAVQSSGDLPSNAKNHDYTGRGLQTQYKHGTGCAEIVHDMAPEAELHLLKISDEIDIYNALDYCAANQIDIISYSLGSFGSGPGDGTGPMHDAFDEARAKGILVVAAAGNEAGAAHWKGRFYDADADGRHEFIPGDFESYYNAVAAVPYQDDDGNPRTNDVSIVMRWNNWPNATVDYDLFLFDYETGNEVGSSTGHQNGSQPPLEWIVIDLPDSEDYVHYYALVVSRADGEPAGVEFELSLGGRTEFIPFYKYASPIATASSSIAEPADAESVFTVGAIDYNNWQTGPQEEFSSQGPTNAWAGSGARIKPDICGSDGTSGQTFGPSSFYGTSAATPHVAGAAALILSMSPYLSPDELQSILESSAVDMGQNGKDNLYGWGRLQITPAYIPMPWLLLLLDGTTN